MSQDLNGSTKLSKDIKNNDHNENNMDMSIQMEADENKGEENLDVCCVERDEQPLLH